MTASPAGSTPAPASGTEATPETGTAVPGGTEGSGGAQEWLMDLGALGIAAVLLGAILLMRRWLVLRSRRPLPGLPPEPVLPLSRHGTLHDPKYLGRILEAEQQSSDP